MTPRQPRFLQNGTCYRIIAKAYERQSLFIESHDYEHYLHLMQRYKMKYDISIFAFCLMSDYVDFILQTSTIEAMASFMQGVSQAYTYYFNARYQRNGSLWNGRYRSVAIMERGDIWDSVKYVEFNPVRAGLTESPVE